MSQLSMTAKLLVSEMISNIGEDPAREGLQDTPKRWAKAMEFLTSGYNMDPADVFRTFEEKRYDQMVLMADIEVYSLCEHHLLPFFGVAHVAYIPGKEGKVIGASKLARLVDIFARRLQMQERVCEQVTEALMQYLKPYGAACVMDCVHLCMRMRGVEKQNSHMVTSSLKGNFLEQKVKEEMISLIKMKSKNF
jgi:GTP cyclohydrolase I